MFLKVEQLQSNKTVLEKGMRLSEEKRLASEHIDFFKSTSGVNVDRKYSVLTSESKRFTKLLGDEEHREKDSRAGFLWDSVYFSVAFHAIKYLLDAITTLDAVVSG